MDEPKADFRGIAISQTNSDINPRDELITKADRERDLGDFTKALALYREAEAMHADLAISIKIAGLMTEQGRAAKALQEWDQALPKFAPREEDPELVAVAEVSRAICAATMNLRFHHALEKGLKYYAEFVKPHPLPEWKGCKLALALLLETPHSILKMSGAQLDPLPWDAATIKELYDELVQSGKFSKAYQVACFLNSGKSKSEVHDLSLIEHLLQQPKLPALLRADILQWKGTLALESGDRDGWLSISEEADHIFRAEGHRSGPLCIEMERLHADSRMQLPYDELKSATIRIKGAFIELGNWTAAKDCMLKLSTLAIKHVDEELLDELNEQYEQIRADCMTTIEWVGRDELMLRYWDFQSHHAAKLAATFEELYRAYVDADMPLRSALIVLTLLKIYQAIGDDKSAEKWASKLAQYAGARCLRPLHMVQPLMRELEMKRDGAGVLPIEAETAWLSNFLAEKAVRYAEDIPRFERAQIIQSILQIQSTYLRRPFVEYKQLSAICFEAVRGFLPVLPPDDRPVREAELLERIGGVSFLEALCQIPASRNTLIDAYNAQAEAAGILESVGERGLPLSGIYASLGQTAQNLWLLTEPATANNESLADLLFEDADDFCSTSLVLAAQEEILPAVQLAITRLHDLWLRRLGRIVMAKGEYDADDESIAHARDQTHYWLEKGREMLETARRGSSALSKSSAAMGKQTIRATLSGMKLYSNAFELAMIVQSPRYLWQWVQDSKARSASDLLALGRNIPETLRDAISRSVETGSLFDEERRIKKRLEAAEGASIAMLHQQLETLRGRMEQDKLADAVLALREGRPTTLEALQAVAQKDVEPASTCILARSDTRMEKLGLHRTGPPRRVFFVDYGFHMERGFIVFAVEGDIGFRWTNVTAREAAEWRDFWLAHRPPSPVTAVEPGTPERYDPLLRDQESDGLRWLSRLAQPLVSISAPGDLFVLCPSDTLHCIPIHASKISLEDTDAEGMCLIERNPIVYTANMTMTEQCMARATSPPSPLPGSALGTANTILGVYRHPKDIHDMAVRISANFTNKTFNSHVSTHLDRTTLQSALGASKTVLFFGHCDTDSTRPADQHLLLDDAPYPDPDRRQDRPKSAFPLLSSQHPGGGDTASEEIRDEEDEKESKLFTIENVFGTPVTASLVTLVACGSAAQAIRTGDEPRGLLTALLCSGANSVVGTMWPVDPRVGVAFAEGFYKRLASFSDPIRASTGGADAERKGEGDSGEMEAGGEQARRVRRMVDLAVVLQETVVELKRSRRVGFDTRSVVDWGAFTLNGAWLLDVLDGETQ